MDEPRDRVAVVYQPIVSLTTGDMIGWEALTRGTDETPFASPLALFSFAAEVDALDVLERICREEALRQGRSLPPGCKLFLNVTPRSFADPPFVKGDTAECCASGGLRRMTWCWRLPNTGRSITGSVDRFWTVTVRKAF
ncbi:EAL domain-containing protein [Calditerricola satsumensis]|uniref:EAL domain-containing protein n=1 Tax=Calditerricola satsumensis TaxID=373054 RepID=UPI00155DC4A9